MIIPEFENSFKPTGRPQIADRSTVAQNKRRKLNRVNSTSLKSMKKGNHGHRSRFYIYNEKYLTALHQERLERKNKRRAQHGLKPLTSYSQV